MYLAVVLAVFIAAFACGYFLCFGRGAAAMLIPLGLLATFVFFAMSGEALLFLIAYGGAFVLAAALLGLGIGQVTRRQ